MGFRRIALFVALGLGEDGLSVAAARSLMTNAFPGKHHWYHLFKYALLSFGVFVLFAQYLLKRTIINKVILISATIPLMFSLLMTVEKGPIINFLIAIFFIYVFVKKEGWITKRVLTVFSIVLLAIALLIYIFTVEFIENRSILIRVAGFFSRLFTGQIEPVYHYLEYFPTVRNFLLGRSFPNFGVLPFDQINLTTELMAWLKPGELSKGVVGSMPTIYWGEMYANFGALGAFIPPLFIGYGLYALNVIVFRLRSSALSIALFVWLMMHFKDLSGTSLSNFILDIYALSIFIVFIILIAFVNSGKIRLVRNIKTN